MVEARDPEFRTEDDLAGPAYRIKLFLEEGPIGSSTTNGVVPGSRAFDQPVAVPG